MFLSLYSQIGVLLVLYFTTQPFTFNPTFISNQVLRPVNDDDPYVVSTLWESRKDFENWVDSEKFRKGHAQSGTMPKEAFTQSNKLELHEVFLDSTKPDLKEEPRGGPFKVH